MEKKNVNFEDVVYFQEGPGVRNWQFRDSGIKLINIRNLVDSELCLENTTNYLEVEEVENKYKHFLLNAGDFVMASSGVTWGKIAEVHEEHLPLCLNTSIIRLVSKDTDVLDKWYLYYYIKSPQFRRQIERLITGSAQPNFGPSHLKKVVINLLEICNQREAVEQFTKVEAVINKRRKEIELLDDLIKARFVELFGESGKQVPLTDYVWFQEGPGVRSVDFTSDGTILLTGSNINDNEISFGYKSDRFISNELATGKYAHFMCDIDDILAVTSAIAPEKFDQKIVTVKEDKKYCLNTGIIRFKPNKDYLTIGYFREFLKTDYFKHQVMSEMRGIAQMHFGPSHLKQMTILLPDSMEKQIEFEQFVKQVDKSKVAVQKALDETQLLFDSLMHKYFG